MWDISVKDIFDIVIVATGMYWLYRYAKKSGNLPVILGILIVLLVWILVSFVLRMRLLGSLLDTLVSVGLIALVVLFQNEMRQALIRIGSKYHLDSIRRLFGNTSEIDDAPSSHEVWITEIVRACKTMAEQRVGALICIQESNSLQFLNESGQRLDAVVSARLIEQIFYKNTPLHDGAMVVAGGRIQLAACVLPVSQNMKIPHEYGLRHRAAMGLAEMTDAKVIIVSEETGSITLAHHGKYHRYLDSESLLKLLLQK